eukprot:6348422-Pyramimonas_sp.AAC.2
MSSASIPLSNNAGHVPQEISTRAHQGTPDTETLLPRGPEVSNPNALRKVYINLRKSETCRWFGKHYYRMQGAWSKAWLFWNSHPAHPQTYQIDHMHCSPDGRTVFLNLAAVC